MAFGAYDPFSTDESFAQRFNTLYGGMPNAPAAPTQSQFGYVSPVNGTWATGPSNLFHAARGIQGRLHSGNDIQAPMGSPAVAMVGGQVVYTGYAQGYGWNAVVKGTDGNMYRYATHGPLSVKFGQQINTGDKIGTIANAPGIPGPHLHFEVIPPTINGAPNPAYQKMAANFGRGLDNFVSTQTWPGQRPLTIDPMKFFGINADTPVALGKPVGDPSKSQAVAAAPDMTSATRDPFGVIQQHVAKEGYDSGQTGVNTGIPPATVGNTPPTVSDTPSTDASRAVSPNILAASQFTGYAPQIRAADYGHPAGPPSVMPASAPATLQNASYTLQPGTPNYLHSPAFHGFTDDFGDTPAHAPGTVPASGPLPRLRPGDSALPDAAPPPSFSAPLTRGITVSNPSDAAVAAYAKANPATAAEIAAYASQFPGNPAKWYSEPGSLGQQAQMAVARAKMTGAPLPGTAAPAPAATGVVSAITPGKDFVNPDGSPAAAPAPIPNAPGSVRLQSDFKNPDGSPAANPPPLPNAPQADAATPAGIAAARAAQSGLFSPSLPTTLYGKPTYAPSGPDSYTQYALQHGEPPAPSGIVSPNLPDKLLQGPTSDQNLTPTGDWTSVAGSEYAPTPTPRPYSPVLSVGMTDNTTHGAVSQLQTQLARLGYYNGPINGIFTHELGNSVEAINRAYYPTSAIAPIRTAGPQTNVAIRNLLSPPAQPTPPGATETPYTPSAPIPPIPSTPMFDPRSTGAAGVAGLPPPTYHPLPPSSPLITFGDVPLNRGWDAFKTGLEAVPGKLADKIWPASIPSSSAVSIPAKATITNEDETASTHPALTAQLTTPPMGRLQTSSNNWGDNTKSALSQGVDPAMIANNSIFYNPTLPAPSGVDYNSPSFQDYNNPYGGNDYSNPGGIP